MTSPVSPSSPVTFGDDLYRELILDHYRHPVHHGEVPNPSGTAQGTNPLCGDEVTLSWRLNDGILTELAFTGKGCAISLASTSMLCQAVHGQPLAVFSDLRSRFKAMLLNGGPTTNLDDLEALAGVAAYAPRIKCALLAWDTLQAALHLPETPLPLSP